MVALSKRTTAALVFAGLSILLTCSCAANGSQITKPVEAEKGSKVDHELIELQVQLVRYKETHQDLKQFAVDHAQLRIVDEQVLIDAIASVDANALEDDLRRLGATQLSSYGSIVSCFFPIERISDLAGLDSLRFARPAYVTTWPATK